jgi:hypothetical protein
MFKLWADNGIEEARDLALIYEHWSVGDPGDLPNAFSPIGELFAR